MTKTRPWLIPAILFLLSLILRLSLVSKGPYHVDCLGFAVNVSQSWIDHKVHFLHGHGYPLTALMGIGFFRVAQLFNLQDPVMAVNLMNALLGSICVVLLFLVVRYFLDKNAAFFSCLLFTVSPIFLSVSTYGNSHVPFLFFFLSALLSLAHYQAKLLPRYLYLSAFLLGLAGASRLQDLAALALPTAYLLIAVVNTPDTDNRKHLIKKLTKLTHAAMITFATLVFFYTLVYLERHEGYFQKSFFRTQFAPFQGFCSPVFMTSLSYLKDNFGSIGIIVSTAGIILLMKNNRPTAFFLLLWLLCPLLTLGNFDTAEPRFILTATIPVLIAQGFALAALYRNPYPAIRLSAVLLTIMLVASSYLTIYPVLSYRHKHNLTGDFARWVSVQTEPDAKIITGDEGFFVQTYSQRTILPQIATDLAYLGTPEELRTALRQYKQKLDGWLNQGIPVYATEIGMLSNNDGLFYQFITRYYDIHYVGKAPFELWQRSCITQRLRWIKLFKLVLKKPLS